MSFSIICHFVGVCHYVDTLLYRPLLLARAAERNWLTSFFFFFSFIFIVDFFFLLRGCAWMLFRHLLSLYFRGYTRKLSPDTSGRKVFFPRSGFSSYLSPFWERIMYWERWGVSRHIITQYGNADFKSSDISESRHIFNRFRMSQVCFHFLFHHPLIMKSNFSNMTIFF